MDPLLVDHGLFGRGLVAIDTPEGIARYNKALNDLCNVTTKLERIDVDGIGWSPQVAVELGNKDYLCPDPANQSGIIASPDQEGKPIQFLSFTFYRRLLRALFGQSRSDMADTTTSACVRLTFDHGGQMNYESPRDLLFIDKVTVQASAGPIMEVARRQRALVKTMKSTPNSWFDADLRKQVAEAGKGWGDLRKRHLEIPDMSIVLEGNFWSRAFGGVFVFTTGKERKVLIVEDEQQLGAARPEGGQRYKAFALSQRREIVDHLMDEHLIDLDMRYYKAHPEDLNDLKKFIVADDVCRLDPECDLHAMSISRRKAIVNQNRSTTPSHLPQLERLQRNLSGRLGGKPKEAIPEDLELMLLHPTDRAGANARPIIRMLLLRLQENPVDVMRLYAYDKEGFFARFPTWPTSKKKWAAQFIAARYKPEMDNH